MVVILLCVFFKHILVIDNLNIPHEIAPMWMPQYVVENNSTLIQVYGLVPNIGSGNGLLHDSTKPLPEPVLTYHDQTHSMPFTLLKLLIYLPEANEFNTVE